MQIHNYDTNQMIYNLLITAATSVAGTMFHRIEKCYWSSKYLHHMRENDLVAIPNNSNPHNSSTTLQMGRIFPTLEIMYKIGLWNLILASTYYLFTAVSYLTPIERQVMNDSRRAYIPKYKRWNRFNWMKNESLKMGKAISSKVDNWLKTNKNNKEQRAQYTRMRKAALANKPSLHFTRKKTNKVIAMAALMAMSAKDAQAYQNTSYFDTDSKPVGIDNRCTACISHDIKDFVGPVHESGRTIKGFGGVRHNSNIMVGTIKWKWCDDNGLVHKHLIPNSYYVPEGKVRLLSPQHWAKSQRRALKSSTGESTNAFECVLQWGQDGKYKLTVPLSIDTNVATFTLAPGYKNFEAYCHEAAIVTSEEDDNPTTVPVVSDDEEEEAPAAAAPIPQQEEEWAPAASSDTSEPRTFDLDGPTIRSILKVCSKTI